MRRVFISYRHEDEQHKARVLDLAGRLEAQGLSVIMDQLAQMREFNGGGPDVGWPRWSQNQAADLTSRVLVVGSPGWFRVFEGKEAPGEGLGVATEAGIINQRIINQGNRALGIRIISFETLKSVPLALQGYHRFVDPDDFPEMVRWLSDSAHVPLVPEAPLQGSTLVSEPGATGDLLAAVQVGSEDVDGSSESPLPAAAQVGSLAPTKRLIGIVVAVAALFGGLAWVVLRPRNDCTQLADETLSLWNEGSVSDARVALSRMRSKGSSCEPERVLPVLLAAAKSMAYRGERAAADAYLEQAKSLITPEREPHGPPVLELKLAQGWVARWAGGCDEALRFFSDVETAAAEAHDVPTGARARLGKVELAIERGSFSEAHEQLNRLGAAQPDLRNEDNAQLHFLRGKLAYLQSRDRDALPELQRAEELYEPLRQGLRRHWAMLYRGATLSFSSDKAGARARYDAVISHARAYDDKRLLSGGLLFRGELNRSENRHSDSERDVLDARTAAEAVGDVLAIGRTWRASARLEDERDNNDAAEKAATMAIEFFHRACAQAFETAALTVRGHLRAEQSRFDDALADLKRALLVYTQLNDDNGKAIALLNIGEIYREQKQYAAAEKILDEAANTFREENRSTSNYANILRAKADLAIDMARSGDQVRLNWAFGQLHDAQLIYEKNSSTLGLANISLAEGLAWLKWANATRALKAFEKAIGLYLEAGKERSGRSDAQFGRARALLALGQRAAARTACDEAIALLDPRSQDELSQRCTVLLPKTPK